MPNVVVAAIGLAVMTLACAIFICRPLHPLIAKVLPSIGAGALSSSQHRCRHDFWFADVWR